MPTGRNNKGDLSVDNVHTLFGLTKHRQAKSLQFLKERKLEFLTQDVEGHVALSRPTHEEM
ncbi:hypothetical protein J2790_001871 [Paenarthrobacter nicotinovorans]|uniref:hypothetical protein n=1 Tax=Micrococcaceae TaxID=1268 RepID=UPI0008764153|nr:MULTISPECIES: hypothetical protein [Micrococcaceae]MDR6436750.1 hypothetical protein [Paenarthrobacter nicotinovorans]SCZ56723.1 hypothetical protein SAMN02799638_01944 [Arthrobacter sp. UNCCL28]